MSDPSENTGRHDPLTIMVTEMRGLREDFGRRADRIHVELDDLRKENRRSFDLIGDQVRSHGVRLTAIEKDQQYAAETIRKHEKRISMAVQQVHGGNMELQVDKAKLTGAWKVAAILAAILTSVGGWVFGWLKK